MERSILIALTATISLFSAGVFASEQSLRYDGNELLRQCQDALSDNADSVNLLNTGMCFGTITGVSDTVVGLQASKVMSPILCIPDGVTTGQMARIVVKYLEENPKDLNLKGATLAFAAIVTTYPCK